MVALLCAELLTRPTGAEAVPVTVADEKKGATAAVGLSEEEERELAELMDE